ncbi:MAG: tetratricopeptide repeat protein [Rhodoluna sp.]
MSELNNSFRGAVDLSALANKVVKDKIGSNSQTPKVTVPAFSLDLSQPVVRSVIEISNVVPVIVSFWDKADAASVSLTQKLEKLSEHSQGKWFLAKLDIMAQPDLAQAFAVTAPATVAMILAGEPRPLFQGDQSVDDLITFLEKLIELAKSQGLEGELVIGEVSAQPEPELSPSEQLALDAMERGEFDAAVEIYQKELRDKPNDETLLERLAQVKLVARTYAGEIETELAVEPKTVAEAMRKADYLLAIGDAETAFGLLLEFFDLAEDKTVFTNHLLELFNAVGKNNPAVIKARRDLAAKMF